MKFSNNTYDKLKWVAQILLPALITLYGTVAMALGLPYTDIAVTIIGAFDAFLGTILGISTKKYNDEMESARLTEFQQRKKYIEEKIKEDGQ